MVVVCASVISKSGRILLGRAFIELSKSRLEGYLQSFPKLVGHDAQHTFIETEQIRYVYQPMESIYVLLITTKNSNIMEDLETLRLFAKLLPEYCGGSSEEQVLARVFELSFAVDELLTHGGYRENVTLQQIKTFTEMDSHEEKLQRIITESKINQARDEARRKASDIDQQKAQLRQAQAMAGGGSKYSSYGSEPRSMDRAERQPTRAAVPEPDMSPKARTREPDSSAGSKTKVKGMQLSKAKKTDDFFAQLDKEEKLAPPKAGPLSATAASSSSSSAATTAAAAKNHIRFTVHETVNAVIDTAASEVKLFQVKGELIANIIDPDESKIIILTTGRAAEKLGYKFVPNIPKLNKSLWTTNGSLAPANALPVGTPTILMKWTKSTTDETELPLSIAFYHQPAAGGAVTITVQYNAEQARVPLQNVLISIPCPSSQAPKVNEITGEYKHDVKNKLINWRIPSITDANQEGSIEFTVPNLDRELFFPIRIAFESNEALSGMNVTGVVQSEAEDQQVEFEVETQVQTEKYEVIEE